MQLQDASSSCAVHTGAFVAITASSLANLGKAEEASLAAN
jgi:hypothetical protein